MQSFGVLGLGPLWCVYSVYSARARAGYQPLIKRLCQLLVPGPTKAVLSLNIAIPEIETLSELQTSGKASEGLGFPRGLWFGPFFRKLGRSRLHCGCPGDPHKSTVQLGAQPTLNPKPRLAFGRRLQSNGRPGQNRKAHLEG